MYKYIIAEKSGIPQHYTNSHFVGMHNTTSDAVIDMINQALDISIRLSDSGCYDLDIWTASLPTIFVNRASSPAQFDNYNASLDIEERLSIQSNSIWTIEMYMNSFMPDLELRIWKMNSCYASSDKSIVTVVSSEEVFFPSESLKQLLLLSGCYRVYRI